MYLSVLFFNRSNESSPAQNKGSEPFHKPETEQSCFGSGAVFSFFILLSVLIFNFILLSKTSTNLPMLGVGWWVNALKGLK